MIWGGLNLGRGEEARTKVDGYDDADLVLGKRKNVLFPCFPDLDLFL